MNNSEENTPSETQEIGISTENDETVAQNNTRRKKNYTKITNDKRNQLIDAVENNNEKITKVCLFYILYFFKFMVRQQNV